MMKPIRIIYRVTGLIALLFVGTYLMGIHARRPKGESSITQKQKNSRQWWLSKVVGIVGLELEIIGDIPKNEGSALWVANHVSWLDIPVVGSAGVAFLAKAEIRKWPFIGWLGEKSGTVYIQRGGQNASQVASSKIAENINSGDSVLVFPEGTTTDGSDVRTFHARIFAPAIDHSLRVQPVAIRYLDEEGNSHPNVVWRDESFLQNVFKILGESSIRVELNFLPILEADKYSERKPLANKAQQQIREILKKDNNHAAR